jgi:hypothetical protein
MSVDDYILVSGCFRIPVFLYHNTRGRELQSRDKKIDDSKDDDCILIEKGGNTEQSRYNTIVFVPLDDG